MALVSVGMAAGISPARGSALPPLAEGRLAGAGDWLESTRWAVASGARPAGREWLTVIGVFPDVMIEEVGEREVTPAAFLPYAYQATPNTGLLVRAAGDATALVPQIRAAIRQSDPGVPVFSAASMEEVRRKGFRRSALFGQMFGVFGAAALSWQLVGVYGVLSFWSSQRTQESASASRSAPSRTMSAAGGAPGLPPRGVGVACRPGGRGGVTRVIRRLALQRDPTDRELCRGGGADAGHGRRGGLHWPVRGGPPRSIRWWRCALSRLVASADRRRRGSRRVARACPRPLARRASHSQGVRSRGIGMKAPGGCLTRPRWLLRAVAAAAIMLGGARPSPAQTYAPGELGTLPVPGGRWALTELGVSPGIERASALRVLLQRRYEAPAAARTPDATVARVQAGLDLALRVEAAARAVSPTAALSLTQAANRPTRDRFRQAMEAIGARVLERRGSWRWGSTTGGAGAMCRRRLARWASTWPAWPRGSVPGRRW